MSKLIVTDGKELLDTVELTPERITIGRHPDNSVQLNDRAVSGHHAVIVNIMSESFLEDLDSANSEAESHQWREVTKKRTAYQERREQFRILANNMEFEDLDGANSAEDVHL